MLWLLACWRWPPQRRRILAFSTSGSYSLPRNGPGPWGAWFSDLALFLLG
jgi:hypothetical protein